MSIVPVRNVSNNSIWTREAHVKIKFAGSKDKINLFNHILGDMDKDWPFRPTRHYPAAECKKCGGSIYNHPRWEAKHLINLARQIDKMEDLPGHLKVKIKRYCTFQMCEEKSRKGAAVDVPFLVSSDDDGGDPEIMSDMERYGWVS